MCFNNTVFEGNGHGALREGPDLIFREIPDIACLVGHFQSLFLIECFGFQPTILVSPNRIIDIPDQPKTGTLEDVFDEQ